MTTAFLLLLALALTPLAFAATIPQHQQPASPAAPWTSFPQRIFSTALSLLWTQQDDSVKYHTFGLRSAYHQGMLHYPGLRALATYDYKVHALDATADPRDLAYIPPIKTRPQRISRPRNVQQYLDARGRSLASATCATLDWDDVQVDAPDTSDRQTILAFAKMSALAYQNDTASWDSFGGYNLSNSFGWQTDGIRGHIFTTPDNSTIVVALKGTSAAFLPGSGDTARRDKANDNLLFSCCCARVSWSWSPVCDCYEGHSSCGQTCLERALVEKSLYYPATTDLFNNISYMYPDAQIWITGHSLGGALSSLLGMTFGAPTVTFEAPGERMAAMRLHLPLPPSHDADSSPVSALPITHVYHTADPIPMGQCNGVGSLCSNLGYAMESRCHAGKSIVYDTVGKLGWGSSMNTHRILEVIDNVLDEDWDLKVRGRKGETPDPGDEPPYAPVSLLAWKWPWRRKQPDEQDDHLRPVPLRRSEDDCSDCTQWHFVDPDSDSNSDSDQQDA